MNTFFISAVHHLLNIFELLFELELKKSDSNLVCFFNRNSKEYEILMEVIDTQEWKDIKFLDLWDFHKQGYFNSVKRIFKFKNEIKKLHFQFGHQKIIASSQFGTDYVYHILNELSADEYIVIDEGNALVRFNNYRNIRLNGSGLLDRKSISFKAKTILFGLNLGEPDRLTMFSKHTLEENSRDKYIMNDFSKIKQQYSNIKKTDEVYLLGVPFCELGILTSQDYIQLLNSISKKYEKKKLIYYMHRNEKEKSSEFLKAAMNIEINTTTIPIELFFLQKGVIPNVIISFYSSALINLQHLLGSKTSIIAYRFNFDLLQQKYRLKIIEQAYAEIEKNKNIQLINI